MSDVIADHAESERRLRRSVALLVDEYAAQQNGDAHGTRIATVEECADKIVKLITDTRNKRFMDYASDSAPVEPNAPASEER